MLLNSINIEGIVDEGTLKELCINDCKICDYNTNIHLNHDSGIKDIYQITLEPTLQNNRLLAFKDENILILKGLTVIKILAVEDTIDNNIAFLQENVYFNFSFKFNIQNIHDIKIFIIDACFNIINNHKIHCSLTYLFNFLKDETPKEKNIIHRDSFNLIDITQEFT